MTSADRAASSFRYFVVVSPGLEDLLVEELAQLGVRAFAEQGGAHCQGPLGTLWSIHLRSRLAESVRLRLRPFHAGDFATLERELSRLVWHAYLPRSRPIQVRVSCHRSRLYHSDAVKERALRVLREQRECSEGNAGPKEMTTVVHIRIVDDQAQVSIEASGTLLHRRGYRLHVGRAPLRETLAAALCRILDGNADPRPTALWDPFCGSGTLLTEWLLARAGGGIQVDTDYAFESWPIHDPELFRRAKETLPVPASLEGIRAYGSDLDHRVLKAARANAERAGVAAHAEFFAADFREASARIPAGAAVVTNLPYGVRLGDREESARLFSALDRLLKERTDLGPAVVLAHGALPPRLHGQWYPAVHFVNRGLRVTAWLGPSGTNGGPRLSRRAE